MYIFGISIELLDLITVFFMVLVTYIIILEYEFKEVIKIVKRFDNEEMTLGKEIRELKEEIIKFKKTI